MSIATAVIATETFLDLERRFSEFLRYVPPDPQQFRVYSPITATIVLDTCSLLEAMLKDTMHNNRYNVVLNIAAIRGKRMLNIGDLRSVFKMDHLHRKRIWFLPRSRGSYPFYAWRKGTQHPTWWNTYNQIKHDRFRNANRASLAKALYALEGAFCVLVMSLEYRQTLVERGIISSDKLKTSQLKRAVLQWEQISSPGLILAKTQLFGYRYLTNEFPRQETEGSVFIA